MTHPFTSTNKRHKGKNRDVDQHPKNTRFLNMDISDSFERSLTQHKSLIYNLQRKSECDKQNRVKLNLKIIFFLSNGVCKYAQFLK